MESNLQPAITETVTDVNAANGGAEAAEEKTDAAILQISKCQRVNQWEPSPNTKSIDRHSLDKVRGLNTADDQEVSQKSDGLLSPSESPAHNQA